MLVALTPLNATALVPVKFVPVIVTPVPTGPLVGVKLAIVGGLLTVKLVELIAVAPGAVRLTGPVGAPVGTSACVPVPDVLVEPSITPLTVTAVAPVKVVPLIVTPVPASPLPGVKLEIVGGRIPVKKTFKTFAVACWIRESTRK